MNPTIQATAEVPAATAPVSFQVYDEAGNIWPPGFKSQLCDPDSPFTMVSHSHRARERAIRVGANFEATQAAIDALALSFEGRLPPVPAPGLAPTVPAIKPGALVEGVADRRTVYFFRRNASGHTGVGEVAWYRLRALGAGGVITCRQLAILCAISPSDVRAAMRSGVEHGAFVAEVRGDTAVYSRGATVPLGVAP